MKTGMKTGMKMGMETGMKMGMKMGMETRRETRTRTEMVPEWDRCHHWLKIQGQGPCNQRWTGPAIGRWQAP